MDNIKEEKDLNNVEKDENKKNEKKTEETDNSKNIGNQELILNKNDKEVNKKKSIKQVIKTFRFWRFALIRLFITFSNSFIINTGRTFGALIGINGKILQILIISQLAGSIFIGPILGLIVDKKGPLKLLKISSLCCMFPGILLTFFLNNSIVFIISYIFALLCSISFLMGFSPFIMEIYGIQESVILIAIISVFSKLSEITTTVTAFVFSLIYIKEELKKQYQIMYIVGCVFCLFGFILIKFEKNKKFTYDKKIEDLDILDEKGNFSKENV